MPLGVYVSLPFCRTKCSYCNFASDVFSRTAFERYTDHVCNDIENAHQLAGKMGVEMEGAVDSIYLGGGTPTLLETAQLERIFATLHRQFHVSPDAEITVECAPGTLTPEIVKTLLRCGVNRASLGVQSFADREAASVGRLHKRATVLEDIERLRTAGITNLNIDLIAGLPHQTADSWEFSLRETISAGVPHVSIYMLEVDEDSRLGRELQAGGRRYHAHFVPNEDAVADFYLAACEELQSAGILQYEISNFGRANSESRHNSKYWMRHPYFGFGVDAHSMLLSAKQGAVGVRFAQPDSLDSYMSGTTVPPAEISCGAALEECFFLGLRLNRGVNLQELKASFGDELVESVRPIIADLTSDGLIEAVNNNVRLTPRGRLLSNEVFQRFLLADGIQR